jgi:hypothetical protein
VTHSACPELANIVVWCEFNDCWTIDYTCVPLADCTRGGETPGEDDGAEPPCVPGYGPGGIYLECDSNGREGYSWDYYIYTWADVPPNRVQIRPFPRWMVAEEGTFSLSRSPNFSISGGPNGEGLSAGFWSDTVNIPDADFAAPGYEPQVGDIKDYRIGVRWRMLSPGEHLFGGPAVPQSCWDFDERAWNLADGYAVPAACGDVVAHTYETSSFGKPQNGPTFDHDATGCAKVPSGPGEWTNPAYQVKVPTYWVAEWADEWYTWQQVGWETPEDCFYRATPPLGTGAAACDVGEHAGEPDWYQLAEPRFDWVHTFIGWYPVDLRQFGGAAWWYTEWAVVTTGTGPWCAYEYADPNPGETVRVPVIEVQSMIVEPCRLHGTCGDLNPPTPEPEGTPAPPPPPPPDPHATPTPKPKPGCGMCP